MMLLLLLAWMDGWMECGNANITQFKAQGMINGAWCWFQDPRAIRYNEKTYIGYVNNVGNVGILSYNHSLRDINTFTLNAGFGVDDHVAPSILIRSDGYLVVFYTPHAGANIYYRISTNPEDISAWGVEQTVVVGPSITYPNPIQLSEESDKIYLFFRGPADAEEWSYIASTDSGVTWSASNTIMRIPAGNHDYLKIVSDGDSIIHFAHSGHPEFENTSIFYFYYMNDSLYRIDGTTIGHLNDTLTRADMDTVYNYADIGHHKAWIWDIAIDLLNYPYIAFATFPDTNDHRYNYARWTGLVWDENEITTAGTYIDGVTQPYYSGGITLDHENTNIVYLSKQISGQFEIQRGITSDGGSSWNFNSITWNSSNKNIRPVCIRNHRQNVKFAWLNGTYTTYLNYNTSVMMIIEQ